MSRFRPLLAIAAVLLTSTIALAEVPREYKSPLSRATSLVTSCESKLKQIRHDFDNGAHRSRGIQLFDRNLGDIADRLEKAKGFAKDFPASIPELAAMTARIAAFEAELARLKADLAGDSQRAANENSKLEAGSETDKAAVEAVSAIMRDLTGEIGSEARVPPELQTWAQAKADAVRLGTAYGNSRPNSPEARQMVNTVRQMSSTLRIVQDKIDTFLKETPGKVNKALTSAEQDAKAAVAAGNPDPFSGSIRRTMQAADILMQTASQLYAAGEPGDQTWIATQRERIAKVNTQAKVLFDKVVSTNSLPKDAYAGGDRVALTAAVSKTWLQSNPHSPPVKVIFPYSEWTRVSKWAWNDSHRSWHKQDYSTLGAAVVIKSKDGKYGYWYMCFPQKDHLNGGSLSVIAMPNEGSEVPADRTVLYSKVR
jgi:hypothetical protein